MVYARIAALAEVLLVLALGNILGAAVYPLIVSDAVVAGTASDRAMAFASGLLIFLRLGSAGAIGLALLYFRTGKTPRDAGLTRNARPLGELLRLGFVLGLISSFLIGLLFFVHSIIPLGEGLAAWWTYADAPVDTTFFINLLATSMLIPPLTEEILMRGYNRVRLVESFGPMAGVILASLVFSLSHTRYLVADGMMLLFMTEIILSSLLWTYSAQKTGSIIPAFIAHAMSNGIASAILFNAWIPFVALTLLMILFRTAIADLLHSLASDWREDRERASLWQGLAIIVLILITALISVSLVGRLATIAGLGLVCLLYTLGFTFREKLGARNKPET